jgi:hypothetical protein
METKMKKLVEASRWLVFGLVAAVSTAALVYANPPTPGRALVKKTAAVEAPTTNAKPTPDNLLW